MKVFLAALIFLGIGMLIMCFNLIFRKNKPFPDSAIEHNKELRKRGINRAREEEIQMWVKKKKPHRNSACGSCTGCGVTNIFGNEDDSDEMSEIGNETNDSKEIIK